MNTFGAPLISGSGITTVDASVFDTMIGQEEARKKLKFYVQSHSPHTPFPTLLFSGSQGLGKTHMAEKVAEALGRDYIEVNCGSVTTARDLIKGVLLNKVAGERPKTILLDEAHRLSSEVTTELLTILNPNKDHTNTIS